MKEIFAGLPILAFERNKNLTDSLFLIQNELMSKKHKNVCRVLDYIDHSLIAISFIPWSISAFTSLARIIIGIASSTIELKICVITTANKNYKSIIKKKRKKHHKIVLLAKSKSNNIKFLIFKDLINSNISPDELVLINIVLKEIYDMKEEMKNSNDK